MGLHDLYAAYHDRVQFLVIYIREAHPTDGWYMGKHDVSDPTTIEERRRVAGTCDDAMKHGIQTYVDEMDDAVMKAYAAWWLFARLAGWNDLKNTDPAILETGSHTLSHINCTLRGDKEIIKKEINKSKSAIEQELNRETIHFAYPAGLWNNEASELVQNTGYQTAVTTDSGVNKEGCDPFSLKRIFVSENFLLFKAQVSGSYFFFKDLWL